MTGVFPSILSYDDGATRDDARRSPEEIVHRTESDNHDVAIEVQAIPKLKEDEVQVKMSAVAFNSKEVSQ